MNDPLEILLEGNRRFSLGQPLHPNVSIARLQEVSKCQKPFALILSCSDSRVPPELVFDCGLGDLFVIRTAGHAVDKVVLESILFGIKSLGIPLVLVLGHANCGAVSLAIQSLRGSGNRQDAFSIVEAIAPAIEKCGREVDSVECIVKAHASITASRIHSLISPITKEVRVVAAYYDLETGIVEIIRQ